jgi:DNA-directed RNA polymerase specialized sigma24 family protein
MWRDAEGELVCGFDAWQEKAMPSTSPRLQRLLEDPRRGLQAAIKIIDTIDDPARQVGAVYQWVGHPISMGDLIYIMQELWNKKDTPDEALEAGVQDPAYDPNMPARVVQEFELQQLWERILQLNLPERTALLLQAQDTDGNSVLELLTLHNITDFDSLANAISITPEELANLWNDLPLDDACIAEHLGVPVKKVAMLRYNAREHLRKQTKKGIE